MEQLVQLIVPESATDNPCVVILLGINSVMGAALIVHVNVFSRVVVVTVGALSTMPIVTLIGRA